MSIVEQIKRLEEENERLATENARLRRAKAGRKQGVTRWRRMIYKAWAEVEPLRRLSPSEVIEKILVNKSWAYFDTNAAVWCMFDGLGDDQQRAAMSLIRVLERGGTSAIQYRTMLARQFEGPAE